MATADDYAAWIVQNADKKGTPEFDTVAQAYQLAKTDSTPKEQPRTENAGIRGDGYNAAMNYSPTDTFAGAIRGAGSIGATLIRPFESGAENDARRLAMDDALRSMGANPDSAQYKTAKLGGEIAGTSGIGGGAAALLSKIPGAAAALPTLLPALKTGGMSAGGATGLYGLLNRVAGGAVSGGLTAGAIDPKDAETGMMIGAASPAVIQAVGKAGQAIGARSASAFEDAKNAFNRRGQINDTIRQSVDAGYKIPPNMVKPSLKNQVIESISGKQATQQIVSLKNSEITDGLVRKALGIADDAPLSAGTLENLRKTAGKAYAEVSSLSPQAANDLEALKVARNEAQGWFKAYNRSARPDDLKLAKEARTLSDSLETALEQHAASAGKPELIPALRDARKQIAKTYTVGRALNDAAGSVDAKVLGRMHEKGLPLSDGLDVAGRFASAFPSIAKTAQQSGSPASHNLKSMASLMMGSGGAGAGIAMGGGLLSAPLAAGAAAIPFVAPAAARSIMFRKGAQRGLVDAAPKASQIQGLLGMLSDQELQQLLLRSAPATSSLLR
jgi:hypothetical protein